MLPVFSTMCFQHSITLRCCPCTHWAHNDTNTLYIPRSLQPIWSRSRHQLIGFLETACVWGEFDGWYVLGEKEKLYFNMCRSIGTRCLYCLPTFCLYLRSVRLSVLQTNVLWTTSCHGDIGETRTKLLSIDSLDSGYLLSMCSSSCMVLSGSAACCQLPPWSVACS